MPTIRDARSWMPLTVVIRGERGFAGHDCAMRDAEGEIQTPLAYVLMCSLSNRWILTNQHVFMGILACKYLRKHVSPVAVEKKTFLISENYAGTRTHKIQSTGGPPRSQSAK